MQYKYDATLEKCPLPLVKLRVILKKMQANDTCLMLISDQGSKKDIPQLLIKLGYTYSLKQINDVIVELFIQK